MLVSDLLIDFGINVQELALLTDIPASRIYKWTKGKGTPKAADTHTLETFRSMYSGKSSNHIREVIAAKAMNLEKNKHDPSSEQPRGRKVEQPVNSIWDKMGIAAVPEAITFTRQEEIEMRIISYNLAALMINAGKGDIMQNEDYQLEVCVRRARKYYKLYFSEN